MREAYKVSVVISTHNRKEELRKLLISLEGQSYPKDYFELVVVDDGSTDGTQHLIEEISSKFEGRLYYYNLPKQENSAITLNIGVQKSKGDIYAFIDSDCIATPDWLENIVGEFGKEEKTGCVGGQETYHDDFPFFVKCCAMARNFVFQTLGVRTGRQRFKFARFQPSASNMAVDTHIFKEVGGFNENFKHSYDVELCYRIAECGYRLVYAPGALVYHKRRATILKNIRQHFEFGRWRIIGYKLHKSKVEILYFLPAVFLLSWIILFAGSFFLEAMSKTVSLFYIFILVILFIAGLRAAAKLKDIRAFLAVPFMLTIQQISYALGSLYALLEVKVPGQK